MRRSYGVPPKMSMAQVEGVQYHHSPSAFHPFSGGLSGFPAVSRSLKLCVFQRAARAAGNNPLWGQRAAGHTQALPPLLCRGIPGSALAPRNLHGDWIRWFRKTRKRLQDEGAGMQSPSWGLPAAALARCSPLCLILRVKDFHSTMCGSCMHCLAPWDEHILGLHTLVVKFFLCKSTGWKLAE